MRSKRELYRDPKKGKIAGVCAGIAECFGVELWLVRILFIAGVLLLAGPFFIVGYVAAWFILEKKPSTLSNITRNFKGSSFGKGWRNTPDTHEDKVEVKAKVWQAGKPPKEALGDIGERYRKIESRLRSIETYVTSREFQLNREISRL